jgi:SAM-dependent methyltransferase
MHPDEARTLPPLSDPAGFWNGRYAEPSYAYGEQPNEFLRDKAPALPPGDVLCLAEGEGRNAVHLAQLGHRVLAQDLSVVGLAKAEALAQSPGVTIQTCCGDLAGFHPAPQSVDLVVAIWMHLPPPLRAQVLSRAVAALRPGGHLILEAYTAQAAGARHRRAAAAGAALRTGDPAQRTGRPGAARAAGAAPVDRGGALSPRRQCGGAGARA